VLPKENSQSKRIYDGIPLVSLIEYYIVTTHHMRVELILKLHLFALGSNTRDCPLSLLDKDIFGVIKAYYLQLSQNLDNGWPYKLSFANKNQTYYPCDRNAGVDVLDHVKYLTDFRRKQSNSNYMSYYYNEVIQFKLPYSNQLHVLDMHQFDMKFRPSWEEVLEKEEQRVLPWKACNQADAKIGVTTKCRYEGIFPMELSFSAGEHGTLSPLYNAKELSSWDQTHRLVFGTGWVVATISGNYGLVNEKYLKFES
jgi:hypothetical protein